MRSTVTLQDVATAAAVHRSTVALALRDNPRISAASRQRIRKLADEMGYRVNPLVAALMSSRRTTRTIDSVAIGYVTCHPTRWGWRPPHTDRPDYFPGAAARAAALGYKLDHFWLGEPGMTPARLGRILSTRNVRGVLIGRLPPGQTTIDLEWDHLACVALGRTLRTPGLHHVTEDHHESAASAMARLIAQGYRRAGFVFSEADDSPRVGDRWLGGYLRKQLLLAAQDRIPPFFCRPDASNADSFRAWFEHWKPDALLVTQAEPVFEWLEKMGRQVPRDIGLATLVNDHPDRGWSGVHCNAEKMGMLATDMLVGLLNRGEIGLPEEPHEVLLTGQWIPGATLALVDR